MTILAVYFVISHLSSGWNDALIAHFHDSRVGKKLIFPTNKLQSRSPNHSQYDVIFPWARSLLSSL